MLGFLLARMGVDTVVLEKHGDFLRDFRGDTIHPSTLEVMHELGLLGEFLKRPHDEVGQAGVQIRTEMVPIADFSHLSTRCRFIAFMPQWDFLDFLAAQGKRYPTFHLRMQAEATELILENGRVAGVRARTPDGPLEVRAGLVVGADGRHSTVRTLAGLEVQDLGAPMDVLWMRLSRHPEDPKAVLGHVDAGRILVMLDRSDYWQCAFVIPKGTLDDIRRRGLPALRDDLACLVPALRDRVQELRDWDDIKLLTVTVDRLRTWYRPGLLCLGDAAHAMSPIGGVGINLAIQDAVAAANILGPHLLRGDLSTQHLRRLQRRREWPTRATQRLQRVLQNRVIRRVLGATGSLRLPWQLRLLRRLPRLRRIPARLIGVGVRPEHVRTPDAFGRPGNASPPRSAASP
jgi:2-polyprenyl-6-methoxyphenol hydroxylase-like FAD-dependent oxidoreductase